MCSAHPGGEVRSCYVGFTIGMWDIAHFVLIIAAGPYIGFLELKKCFFQQVFWVRRNFVFF